jgi:hypothetical protein
MQYKDENGNILYGYSLEDLKKNNELIIQNTAQIKLLKDWVMIGAWFIFIIGFLSIIIVLYVLSVIMKNHILTNIVRACL